ncbi:MAG TPA: hypothetical protein VEY12_00815 [Thermoplasmata archaeon]|nr:hypothetical protein [Thermoplasmata archaeon]
MAEETTARGIRIEEPRPKSRTRRTQVLIAALVAWAAVATGILGWTLSVPSGPSQTAIWDSDARVLLQLDGLFGLTQDSLRQWATSQNLPFGLDALNLTVAASGAASFGELYGPGHFASGAALNLTAKLLHCDYAGLFNLVSLSQPGGLSSRPWLAGELDVISRLYGNLSLMLRVTWGGNDPVAQLGAQTVAEIRAQADALHSLNAGYAHSVDYSCPSTWPCDVTTETP